MVKKYILKIVIKGEVMTREERLNNLIERYSGGECEGSFFDLFNRMIYELNETYDHFEKQQLENLAHLQMANELIEKQKKELDRLKGLMKSGKSFGIRCGKQAQTIQETHYWQGYQDACGEIIEAKDA